MDNRKLKNIEEFELIIKPVMKWLAENHNPHTKVIIESNSAELLQSEVAITSDEFIVD
ncbi:hypothetical protein [Providencia alcalifaciens]|uniref:hypothetical protein n=1 Tax=Providencia alcalifaciens TaxID=126385 RepID=UPI0004473F60|nr:hypothetical protein [Providencia alcalifaciens]EUC95747.1 hypothetical protein HMPREF1567_2479 [Providencia alcalifaciens PAL-2]